VRRTETGFVQVFFIEHEAMNAAAVPEVESAGVKLTAEEQQTVVRQSARLLEALHQNVAAQTERLRELHRHVRIGRRTE
jgi:hypothetical protein